MNPLIHFKIAFIAIWANKMRSFLTMLGVIIGVSAVTTLIAMGQGVKKEISSLVEDLGSNIIIVLPGDIDIEQSGFGGGTSNPANIVSGDILKRQDAQNIKKLPEVEKVAAISLVTGILSREGKKANSTPVGADDAIQYTFGALKIDKGRFINDETDYEKKVIILGKKPTDQLFENEDPLGKKVTFNKDEFEVIGILKPASDKASLFSGDLQTLSVIPISTAKQLTGDKEKIFRIAIKGKSEVDSKVLAKKIEEELKKNHQEKDYSIFTQDDILGMLDKTLNIMTAFISAIAAISLLVSGIGISNIMLVSVTERTREIGLRKAVGATSGNILVQFLIEAMTISLLGGAIGVLCSLATVIILRAKTSLNPVITFWAILLAVGVCFGVGIVFGLVPAIRASRKNPIEALRYE